MATGLTIPVSVSPSGGFATSSGKDHDSDIIRSALGSDENENSFQQNLGLGEQAIFDINDELARASIITRLRAIFARFETLKRYKLLENTIEWMDLEGEQVLTFKYVNLETDQLQDYQQSFASQQSHSA